MSSDHQDETRLRILRGALKVFADKGFYGATTREIAKEADANVASISYHFQGKSGLLTAVMEEFVAPQIKETAALLKIIPESELEVSIQLELFLSKMTENYFSNMAIFHIYLRVLESNDVVLEGILPLIEMIYGSLKNFLQRGKESGMILFDGDSDVAAIMILTSFTGLIKNELTSGRIYPVSLKDEAFVGRFFKQVIARAIH